jgi:hypothetical protein
MEAYRVNMIHPVAIGTPHETRESNRSFMNSDLRDPKARYYTQNLQGIKQHSASLE